MREMISLGLVLPLGGVISYCENFCTPVWDRGLHVMGGAFLRPLRVIIISSGDGAGDIIELGSCIFELGVDSNVTVTPANWRDKSARAPLVRWAAGVPLVQFKLSLSIFQD